MVREAPSWAHIGWSSGNVFIEYLIYSINLHILKLLNKNKHGVWIAAILGNS